MPRPCLVHITTTPTGWPCTLFIHDTSYHSAWLFFLCRYTLKTKALWLFEILVSAQRHRITLLKTLNTWVPSLYTHVQTCNFYMYSLLHLWWVLPQACILEILRSGHKIEQVLKERSLSSSVLWSSVCCYWCVTRSKSQEITCERKELMRCVYLVCIIGSCACNPPQE